jgi:uncharacterized protein YecE (DUF72 family)
VSQTLVGCSGWNYGDPVEKGAWKGVFYPEGEKKYLRYYSRFFNTAEFDAIFYERFYNDMKQGLFFGLSRATPDGFQFSLKVPETITHKKKLDVRQGAFGYFSYYLEKISPLKKYNKLGAILFQLPPWFTVDDFRKIESFLDNLPREYEYAVEFRHESWQTEGALEMLEHYGIASVLTDSPDSHTLLKLHPPPPEVYVRINVVELFVLVVSAPCPLTAVVKMPAFGDDTLSVTSQLGSGRQDADTCSVLPAGLDFKGAYDKPVVASGPFLTSEALERTSLGKYMYSTLGPSNPGEISTSPALGGGIKIEGREKMQIIFADFKGSGFEHVYAAYPDSFYRQIVIDPSYGQEYTSWLLSHETGRLSGLENGEEFGKHWTDVLESKKANGEPLFGRW